MCGIVGYVGYRPAQDILLGGLEKLEYRGYDSAGISLLEDGELRSVRAVGNLSHLKDAVDAPGDEGAVATAVKPATTGIGHTRWATHGRVTEENAHPHYDMDNRVHVVVNGIVENYLELKQQLHGRRRGVLLRDRRRGDRAPGLAASWPRATAWSRPTLRAYARLRRPLRVRGRVAPTSPACWSARARSARWSSAAATASSSSASGIPAFLEHTRDVQVIENDEIVVVTPEGVRAAHARPATEIDRAVETVEWDAEQAEKGGYETFMLKEIHEQADAVAETIADRTVRPDGVDLYLGETITDELLRDVKRIVVVACGTSYHAGLIGRYAIEEWARVPVEMDVASEYRYRNPVVGPGRPGHRHHAVRARRRTRWPPCAWPRERGATVLAVTNIMGSQATRDADGVLYTRAGLEICVAATKTFIAQVAAMYLLALRLAELRGTLDAEHAHPPRRRPQAHPAPHRRRCSATHDDAIERAAEAPLPGASSSSTSAATSGCRWRSRARSSSRRSPTSRPTPTRPAR